MGLRHMVVVDGEEARGMITRKDLLTPSLLCRLEELQEQLASARNSEAEEESGRGESAVVGMTPPVNETAAPSGVGNENSAKEGETAPPPAEAPAAGVQQNDELLDDLFR
ncbi:hypothetical protein, conserved [Angomonas deanei]|uniref:CBS domain-containing protein n=1 Tax=Angomonas deanei TaxID=59799 RepID=A0A7G2CK63_9TRYP|nr:hypothetical protein, conserved [Angomonas deanei]